ncbi:MAG TPA: AAA family ATPase, partial [Vulgatibacter sp.]
MLAALRIESLAIVDSLEVRFERGLNVLTGETGAGKSILVDALDLLLGGRADPGCVRAGCDEAVVEGLFVGPGLAERAAAVGLPADADEILVRRTVSRSGRGRVHVNGALATVSLLGALTRGLVDLSGQHEHVSLLRKERHLDLLDAFGGAQGARREYEEAYADLAAARAERARLQAEEAERARRRDYLAFQLAELDELAPEPEEDVRLADERRLLAGAEKLRSALDDAEGWLVSGDEALVDRLGAVVRRLEEAARIDPALEPLAGVASSARSELDELGRELRRRASSLAAEPERLVLVEERLEALRHLARKHGGSLEGALGSAA